MCFDLLLNTKGISKGGNDLHSIGDNWLTVFNRTELIDKQRERVD